jgi:DNA-binding response OmpR family regulator
MAAIESTRQDSGLVQLDEMQCTSEVNILVIDDDAATCKVVEAVLAHKDFSIRTVNEPAKVEAVLKSDTQYHVVVLDYVLPGLQTENVLEWLQEYQADADIIVITGYPTLEGALNSLRARAFEYLTKPFQIAQLQQTVVRSLQAKGLLRLAEEAIFAVLGRAIRDQRKLAGLTLAELARRADVSTGYLSQIELGHGAPTIEKLYRISLALGIRMIDLIGSFEK